MIERRARGVEGTGIDTGKEGEGGATMEIGKEMRAKRKDIENAVRGIIIEEVIALIAVAHGEVEARLEDMILIKLLK